MKEPRLAAGVGVDPQSVRVLPRDMNPSRNSHQPRSAVSFALISHFFILRRIPRIGNSTPLGSERDTRIIAFRWCHHPVEPILGYHRYPVSRKIHHRPWLTIAGLPETSESNKGMRLRSVFRLVILLFCALGRRKALINRFHEHLLGPMGVPGSVGTQALGKPPSFDPRLVGAETSFF